MAGLVGVLRQLGDLAEFAAEIFHDLHEEVMSTATRGHGLMVRVQQFEADFPTAEKALLSQTNHSSFYSDTGVDWHPNLHSEQNVITHGDLPRFVLDSYEESRGPPRLFLLDKFDGAGAGACLKRYTDPAFFKAQSAFSLASEDIQKERKIHRVKHKKGSRWRNGKTPEVLLPSHSKLHELFLEERISNGYSDPARRVKLKKRHLNGSAVDSRTRKSYMDKFLDTHSPECKLICATSVTSLPLKSSSDNDNESELRIIDISIVSPAELSPEQGSASYLTNKQEVLSNHLRDYSNEGSFDGDIAKGSEPNSDGGSVNSYSNLQMVVVENELEVGVDDKTEGSIEGYSSDNLPGDVDNFVDALANMESELDTDNESRAKSNESELVIQMKGDSCRIVSDANEEEHLERQAQSLDSQSNENSVSDDWNNSSERERASLNSDSPSNKSDAAGKELPSTESSGSEGTCNEDGMAADRGDISCNRLVREMSPTREHPDHGANSPLASYVEPLLDESSSDKENGTSMDHFMVVASNDSSRAMDEIISFSPALSPVEADDATLCATSEDLPHLKNVEELSSVNQSGNDSENYVCQAKSADEDTVGSFTSAKTDSSHLSPPTEEQLLPAAMDDVQTSSGSTVWSHSSDVAKPVKRVSQANDPVKPSAFKSGVIPWRRISRESYPEEDASQTPVLKKQKDDPQTSVLIDQQICDLDEDTTHSKEKFSIEERSATLAEEEVGLTTCNDDSEGGDSAYEEIPSNLPAYSGDGDHLLSADMESAIVHVEDVTVPFAAIVKSDDINDFIGTSPGTTSVEAEEDMAAPSAAVVKSDDTSDFIDASSGTTSVDAEEGDSVSLELPSNSPTGSGLGNLVISDSMVSEAVLREELAVSSASVAKSDDVIDINTSPDALCLPPSDFIHLHKSLPDSRDPHTKESEIDEVASPKPVSDSEMLTVVTDVVLLEPESDPSIPVAYDPSILEVNDKEHNFSLDEQNDLGATVCDAPTTSTSLESGNHESQSETLDQSDGEYHVSSFTSALPEVELQEAETKFETPQELEDNEVRVENWGSDGARDQLEASALEQSPEVYSGHLSVEDPKDDECSTNSLHSQQTGLPSQSDRELPNLPSTAHIVQDTCFDDSSESLPENVPSQPSTSKFFTESVSQETGILKQKVEPLESIFPNFILPPPVVDLESPPPLPPLPPMQWRLGKTLHSSPASHRDSDKVGSGLLFPMQSLKANEKAQFDLPVPQRDLLQHQNPFLPFTSEEEMKSQPILEPLVGHLVSLPYPQVPIDNDSAHQYNFSDLEGMQLPSQLISKESGDNSGQNDIVLEGEKGLSGLESFVVPSSESKLSEQDLVFSHREIVDPKQLLPETSLELETHEQSFNGPELEEARPLATSVTAPTMEDEQPQHSLPTTEEGEQVQCTSNLLIVPGTEWPTPESDVSYSRKETIKPPQHTQDSGLEPEEREREKPHDTTLTTTTMIDEKPAYSLSTSDGKAAWSSNTSDVIPDSEVGKSDGTINKIPRPRNPLIDAVTAHGQSKLKKASERIQPQIEPKVEERDLFLHQIRNKSFNLKPAPVTRSTPRPSIQGQNPNLKVMSLLEKKAIAIRQAFAGSDEDDDDSWSD